MGRWAVPAAVLLLLGGVWAAVSAGQWRRMMGFRPLDRRGR